MRSSPRRRAREFVLQGLYQQQLSGNADDAIRAQLAEATEFPRADREYFTGLWSGIAREHDALLARVAPYLDRPPHELSPIERGILYAAALELSRHLETPFKVVMNEAIELGKAFGGTDGHRFVNGVLERLARSLRPVEAARAKQTA